MLYRRALSGAFGALAALAAPAAAQDGETVAAAVLRVEHERPLPISRLDLPPDDLGFAGARLGLEDNRTTGSFLGQEFSLEEVSAAPDEAVEALQVLIEDGVRFVATMADADVLLELSDAAGERALLFNASAEDERLRGEDCRANVMHLAPSRSMRTDALAQFLMVKQWGDWFLIEGSNGRDTLLADAYRRSAEKFGARIVEDRLFEDTGGARRTDMGHVQVQAQMPVFTQRAASHHVLVAADETEVFAAHLPYHTWDARPVAGSAGLTPVTWHPAQEAWGGTQLQTRFDRLAERPMRPEDYNVWMAIRTLGEAATRTGAPITRRCGTSSEDPISSLPPSRASRSASATGTTSFASRSCSPPTTSWSRSRRRISTSTSSRRSTRSARTVPRRNAASTDQNNEREETMIRTLMATAAGAALALPASAYTVYVSNERGNSITIIDHESGEVVEEVPVGQRPRGINLSNDGRFLYILASDDDTVQVMDTETRQILHNLPSGPDPELGTLHPSGNPLYVANEDDNIVTVIDVEERRILAEIPVGIEPEGMGVSPDGRVVVNTSETTNMAHFIDSETYEIFANILVDQRPRFAEFTADGSLLYVSAEIGGTVSVIDSETYEIFANILVDQRPRFAEFTADGSLLYVSAEIGGTVSVIDPSVPEIVHKIEFEVAGIPPEALQPVGVRVTQDGSKVYVALGPSNRVALVDGETWEVLEYFLVGQRVWQLAFTPDEKFLYTTNGISNDVSVIDVENDEVVRSIQVGQQPWGVAIADH